MFEGRAFVELRVDFSPGSAVAPWKVEDEKQPDSSEVSLVFAGMKAETDWVLAKMCFAG